MDVGGAAGPEHRQAEDIEAGGAGDHAAVVRDPASPADCTGDLEPRVVGPEAGRPHHGSDLPGRQVNLQRRAAVHVRRREPVRRGKLVVDARRGGPLIGPAQEPVHFEVGK